MWKSSQNQSAQGEENTGWKFVSKLLIGNKIWVYKTMILLPKWGLEKMSQKNLICKLDCQNYEKTYVGQTKRLLSTRKSEHLTNFNYYEKNHNVVSKLENDMRRNGPPHEFYWENIQIIHKEKNCKRRCVEKMVFIKKQNSELLLYFKKIWMIQLRLYEIK